MFVFVFKQKTAYDVRISDWSSDVCSSDLVGAGLLQVWRRQRATVARGERQAFAFVVRGNQRVAQVVVPVAHDVGQLGLERGLVELDHLARTRAHEHVQLRQRRFAHLQVGVDMVGVQLALEQRFDAHAQVGVVAVARQVHERRIEAPVAVAAQEQLAAHALLQAKDARGQLQQLVLAGLRSEEHTSELQSLMRISYAVFCLKKKKSYT